MVNKQRETIVDEDNQKALNICNIAMKNIKETTQGYTRKRTELKNRRKS